MRPRYLDQDEFCAAKFIGAYEHHYDNNVFGQEGFGAHYIDVLKLDHRPNIVSDKQQIGFRRMIPTELTSSRDVHQNARLFCLRRREHRQTSRRFRFRRRVTNVGPFPYRECQNCEFAVRAAATAA
jgi:hypothetical protein